MLSADISSSNVSTFTKKPTSINLSLKSNPYCRIWSSWPKYFRRSTLVFIEGFSKVLSREIGTWRMAPHLALRHDKILASLSYLPQHVPIRAGI